MNYFAHGRRFVEDPWFVAGTATPDWLNVVNRRARVRSRHVSPYVEDRDPRVASFAAGVARHHHDDGWFHGTRAFAELSLEFTVLVRDALPPDDSLRPSFLGHILVELLLDAELIERDPASLEAYYRCLERVDPVVVRQMVEQFQPQQVEKLPLMVEGFCQSRFLFDYLDDGKLWYRLNQVMQRVKLPELPASFRDVLPGARGRVRDRAEELLAEPTPLVTNSSKTDVLETGPMESRL